MGEGTNTQIQQDNGSISNPEAPPKKKTCILTKILCGCIVGLVAVYFSAIVFQEMINFDGVFVKVIEIFAAAVFIGSPFLAIASLIRINLHPDRLKGGGIAILLLVIACLLNLMTTYMMAPAARMHGLLRKVVCGTNLKGLGTAFVVYTNDYDDVLPTDNWCDRLIEEADVSPRSFQCYETDSVEGESDYCLNVHAAGKNMSELPADMVLLFEYDVVPSQNQIREPIKNRENFSNLEIISDIFTGEEEVYLNQWNQVGGPESLAYDHHEDGCNILFADGHTEFVKTEELTELKWNIEGTVRFTSEMMLNGTMPEPQKEPFVLTQTTTLLAILGGVCVVVTFFVFVRFKTLPYLPFVLIITVLSIGTGMFFGNMSENAYLSKGTTGLYSGGFFGLLVGICFPILLVNAPDRIKTLRTFVGFSASVGMVTGFICSTLVHLALIIVNKETNFAGILIGIPYGIAAGAVLGLISGLMLKKRYKSLPIESNAETGKTE